MEATHKCDVLYRSDNVSFQPTVLEILEYIKSKPIDGDHINMVLGEVNQKRAKNIWQVRWTRMDDVVFPYECDRSVYENRCRYPPPVRVAVHPMLFKHEKRVKVGDGLLQLGFVPTDVRFLYVYDKKKAEEIRLFKRKRRRTSHETPKTVSTRKNLSCSVASRGSSSVSSAKEAEFRAEQISMAEVDDSETASMCFSHSTFSDVRGDLEARIWDLKSQISALRALNPLSAVEPQIILDRPLLASLYGGTQVTITMNYLDPDQAPYFVKIANKKRPPAVDKAKEPSQDQNSSQAYHNKGTVRTEQAPHSDGTTNSSTSSRGTPTSCESAGTATSSHPQSTKMHRDSELLPTMITEECRVSFIAPDHICCGSVPLNLYGGNPLQRYCKAVWLEFKHPDDIKDLEPMIVESSRYEGSSASFSTSPNISPRLAYLGNRSYLNESMRYMVDPPPRSNPSSARLLSSTTPAVAVMQEHGGGGGGTSNVNNSSSWCSGGGGGTVTFSPTTPTQPQTAAAGGAAGSGGSGSGGAYPTTTGGTTNVNITPNKVTGIGNGASTYMRKYSNSTHCTYNIESVLSCWGNGGGVGAGNCAGSSLLSPTTTMSSSNSSGSLANNPNLCSPSTMSVTSSQSSCLSPSSVPNSSPTKPTSSTFVGILSDWPTTTLTTPKSLKSTAMHQHRTHRPTGRSGVSVGFQTPTKATCSSTVTPTIVVPANERSSEVLYETRRAQVTINLQEPEACEISY